MKNGIFTVVFAILTTISFGQQAEKILVKSFNLHGNDRVTLDVTGPVDVQAWDKDIMQIQMTINLANGTNAMLKSLVQGSRYKLHGKEIETGYLVYMPNMAKSITIGGKPLVENLRFTVYKPESVVIASSGITDTQITVGTKFK